MNDIFNKFKSEVRPVECCPGLLQEGKRLFCRSVNYGEFCDIQRLAKKHDDYARPIMVRCACDEAGNRLFRDGDMDSLSDLPVSVLSALAAVFEGMVHFRPEDEKKA